jgi:hypothetical protein
VEGVLRLIIASTDASSSIVSTSGCGGAHSGGACASESRFRARVEPRRGVHAAVGSVATHWWEGRRRAHGGRHAIPARGSSEAGSREGTRSAEAAGTKGSAARSTAHWGLTHTEGRIVDCIVVGGVGNDRRLRARGAATQTIDVLGEVVVVAGLNATTPVTRAEWCRCTEGRLRTTADTVTVGTVVHHLRAAVAVAVTHGIMRGHCLRERIAAAEAGSTTLEVAEAAGRASPVARAGSVLAWWEGRQDFGSTIEHTRRRWRDLNGLFVKCTAVHAETLSSLRLQMLAGWSNEVVWVRRIFTSSCDENTAKPVPVGLC